MGTDEHIAMGTIRFSVGRETTVDEVDRAAEMVIKVVCEMRETTV